VTGPHPTLSIVIPAWNEEAGIASIVERTLAARPAIQAEGGVGAIEVIVVDDGSTDRTAAIARGYADLAVVSHPKNRGYGAAIKTGFANAHGDLLAFLDADGTCDPGFFATLCTLLRTHGADVAVGARLGPGSRMPALRRLGNRLFAGLIRLWGGSGLTDSASGMRVIRREALDRLAPLPDGMHFTPAMSSRAIFDPHLSIVEAPMPYDERTGDSKLRVMGDGLRFLRTIVDTALTYRPLRLLGSAGLVALALGMAYGIHPVSFYLREGHLEERMIYRLVAVVVAVVVGVNLLAVGIIGQQAVAVIHEDFAPSRGFRRLLDRVLLRFLVPWGLFAIAVGVALNWSSLVEYATTRQISAHWIYTLTGGLLVSVGTAFVAFGVLARVVGLLAHRKAFRLGLERRAAPR
jgi:glycosyltransferase involved in cell wall biosynthesis